MGIPFWQTYPCLSSGTVVSISILFLALNKFNCKLRSLGIPSFLNSADRLICSERFLRPEPEIRSQRRYDSSLILYLLEFIHNVTESIFFTHRLT